MTRNRGLNRPDDFEISWSSSGSEDERPRQKKKSKWINLRILTPNDSIAESTPPLSNTVDIRFTPSPTFCELASDLSPVINVSCEKSPIIGENRKYSRRAMCQLSKRLNVSPDIFPTQYNIEFCDTQKSLIYIDHLSPKKVDTTNRIISLETKLDIENYSSEKISPVSNTPLNIDSHYHDLSTKDVEITNNSSQASVVSIENHQDLSPVESHYEIDCVSSQDVKETISGELSDNSDYETSCVVPAKRKRFKKGGFASQALAAIKYHEANVHIWRHEMYLSTTSGDEILSVQPELIKKFSIINVREEFGRKVVLCKNERLQCLVLMENCDSSQVVPGKDFQLYPPYVVKQITQENICYDVYLAISKILFSNK